MNKILLIGFIATLVASLAACNKSDGGGGSGYAATPQPCNVNTVYSQNTYPYGNNGYNNGYYPGYGPTPTPYPNPVNQAGAPCNNGYYPTGYPGNQQWTNGQWYWPNQWQPTGNNCGCPYGYYQVYGQTFGVACAPNAYFNNSSVVYWNSNWYMGPTQNNQWLNTPQAQYVGPSVNNCSTGAAQGCDTRVPTCPAGTSCRPVGGGSTIGLCTQ